MRSIDCIYMINLDQRPEKFARSSKELNPYEIFPQRFSAVNGWELSQETLSNTGVPCKKGMKKFFATCYPKELNGNPLHEFMQPGRNYVHHGMSKGGIGIVLSHIAVLKKALELGYQTIWVMEDDVQVIQSPLIIPDLIERLDAEVGKENWDILFTDRDSKDRLGNYKVCSGFMPRPNYDPPNTERFSKKTVINKEFTKIDIRFGTYSMILRRSGMKKIVDFISNYKIFLPYDMDLCLAEDISMYAVNEDIVSTLTDALSDNL